MATSNDLYNQLITKIQMNNDLFTGSAVGAGSHVHSMNNDYNTYQSLRLGDVLNMTADEFIIGFDCDGQSRVLKNRVSPPRSSEELDLLIELFARALVKKFLQEKMFLFERTLTEEMIHAIKQTLLKEEEPK